MQSSFFFSYAVYIYIYIYKELIKKEAYLFFISRGYVSSKAGNHSRGQPEGSVFNSYYIEV